MHKDSFDKHTANKVSEDQWVKDHEAHGSEDELRDMWKSLQHGNMSDKPKQASKKEK